MIEDGTYNAIIEKADIYKSGSLTLLRADIRIGKSLHIDYGPICIGNKDGPWTEGITLISRLMSVADVEDWSNIKGRPCRAVVRNGWVALLIHFMLDDVTCDSKRIRLGLDIYPGQEKHQDSDWKSPVFYLTSTSKERILEYADKLHKSGLDVEFVRVFLLGARCSKEPYIIQYDHAILRLHSLEDLMTLMRVARGFTDNMLIFRHEDGKMPTIEVYDDYRE